MRTLEIKTHCPVFVCFLQTSMAVIFREMSGKMTMPCSNLLTVEHAGLIWYFVTISSIKLLSYKVTVKHFTHNIIFEFCLNKRKQCCNEEPKEMPLRVQLSFFPLASTERDRMEICGVAVLIFF